MRLRSTKTTSSCVRIKYVGKLRPRYFQVKTTNAVDATYPGPKTSPKLPIGTTVLHTWVHHTSSEHRVSINAGTLSPPSSDLWRTGVLGRDDTETQRELEDWWQIGIIVNHKECRVSGPSSSSLNPRKRILPPKTTIFVKEPVRDTDWESVWSRVNKEYRWDPLSMLIGVRCRLL